jgi:hypothetical protein
MQLTLSREWVERKAMHEVALVAKQKTARNSVGLSPG